MNNLIESLEKFSTITIEEFTTKFASGVLIYDKETGNLICEIHTNGTYALYENISKELFEEINEISKELKNK